MITIGEGISGKKVGFNLARLIETRLLIQANSGGGKSFLIRKILEETHGKAQQIVFDMEGEFATLREKFDYILAGKGGDIPADPKSAELLARKVLELGTSIIIDLYELKAPERHRFIRLFLDAMINAPKELWHEVIVVVDEAHIFCPEKGHSEAMGSVIDLCSRGRKRGYCAILASQRIAKLHKDAAAECLNKLVGRTSLDIDMKRASDDLGFTMKLQTLSLRDLAPGEFFAFGPAIDNDIQKITVDPVQTKHPKAGQRLKSFAPKPTEKVKHILSKLTDLPKEAEEELHDKQSMLSKIRELQIEIRDTKRHAPDPKDLEDSYKRGYAKGMEVTETAAANWVDGTFRNLQDIVRNYSKEYAGFKIEKPKLVERTGVVIKPGPIHKSAAKAVKVEVDGRSFGRCDKSILQFLAMRESQSFNRAQVGAMTGYAHTSGSFNNAVSNMAQAGLLIKQGDRIQINQEAISRVQEILGAEYKAGDPHSLEEWLTKLGKCERSIYEKLLEVPDVEWEKEKLGEETNYSPDSGSFNNAISRLCTLGLAERIGKCVRLNPEIRDI